MDSVKKEIEVFDDALSKLFYYLKSHQTWKSITDKANIEIDRTSLTILHIISKSKKSLRVNDIARILEIEAPSVSRNVKKLEDSKLVKRIVNEDDKRSAYFIITKKAEEIDKKMRLCRQNISMNILNNWKPQDRAKLVDLLNTFVQELTNNQKGK